MHSPVLDRCLHVRGILMVRFTFLAPVIHFHPVGVVRVPDMDSAESSSYYPAGHGVGHPQGVLHSVDGHARPSLPDLAPRSGPYVAVDNQL